MAYSHHDRLTALDALFLELEDANVHMHVGSVSIFEGGSPLETPEGGADFERVYAATESALQHNPRFRQRLAWIPLFDHPVWVDDDRFNLLYHLRHTSLPEPGGVRQLKRLAGRILSQQLDRGKPLWEMWLIDGLEGGGFAVLLKMHHCMIDGIAGVDLIATMMRLDPDPTIEPARTWIPRPAPSRAKLLADELARRASLPGRLLGAARGAAGNPRGTVARAGEALAGVGEVLAAGLHTASPTPLNTALGPHRRFDWLRTDLGAVQEVKRHLGGTVNDVVLAVVAGSLRRFLQGRGARVDDLDFRALVPVNVRAETEHGRMGNRVSFLVAPLPIGEAEPRRRLERVIETTRHLKESRQVAGTELLEEVSDWTFTGLFAQYARLGARARAYNLVVTNIPGPQVSAWFLGARMAEIHPLVPLYTNQSLGIALFSYAGGLHWGFNADWDAVPDLHDLVDAVGTEIERLRKAAVEARV